MSAAKSLSPYLNRTGSPHSSNSKRAPNMIPCFPPVPENMGDKCRWPQSFINHVTEHDNGGVTYALRRDLPLNVTRSSPLQILEANRVKQERDKLLTQQEEVMLQQECQENPRNNLDGLLPFPSSLMAENDARGESKTEDRVNDSSK